MGAVAFTETLILRGLKDQRVIHVPLTVSDVNGEYAVGPDGNGFIQIPADQHYLFSDLIVETGGTDTRFQDVFLNSLATGLRITNKANLSTAGTVRQFQGAPIPIKSGSLMRLKQIT